MSTGRLTCAVHGAGSLVGRLKSVSEGLCLPWEFQVYVKQLWVCSCPCLLFLKCHDNAAKHIPVLVPFLALLQFPSLSCRQERLREAFPHPTSIPRHLKKSSVLLCSSSARTGDTHVPLQMLGETGMNTRKEEKVVVPSKLFNILSNTCSVSWTVSSPSSFVLRC